MFDFDKFRETIYSWMQGWGSISMGLKIKRQPSKGIKFNRQLSKKVICHSQPWKMKNNINRKKSF